MTGLAKKYGKTAAQVLLRYSIQKVRQPIQSFNFLSYFIYPQEYIPIPKSSSKERIIANTQIYDFELTKEEVAYLDTLDEGSPSYDASRIAANTNSSARHRLGSYYLPMSKPSRTCMKILYSTSLVLPGTRLWGHV